MRSVLAARGLLGRAACHIRCLQNTPHPKTHRGVVPALSPPRPLWLQEECITELSRVEDACFTVLESMSKYFATRARCCAGGAGGAGARSHRGCCIRCIRSPDTLPAPAPAAAPAPAPAPAPSLCPPLRADPALRRLVCKCVKHPEVKDYARSIEEVDHMEGINLRMCAIDLRNNFTILFDVINKNIDRLGKPKETNRGGIYG